jgi:cysteine desulfurase/selenocysteine lyase
VPATTRASLGVHNQPEDLDALVVGIRRAQQFFGVA